MGTNRGHNRDRQSVFYTYKGVGGANYTDTKEASQITVSCQMGLALSQPLMTPGSEFGTQGKHAP